MRRAARAALAGAVVALLATTCPVVIARADGVSDNWHDGWCREDEAGFSVVIDFTGLPADQRGELSPDKSGHGEHTRAGWLVRCHQSLDPISDRYWEPENYVTAVGILVGFDSTSMTSDFLGVARGGSTNPDLAVSFNVLAVVPEGGQLPSWPEGVREGDPYPGKPADDDPDTTFVPERPVKGMAVIVTASTRQGRRAHGAKLNHYWVGANPNSAEHRPQIAAPLPQPEPSDEPTGEPTGEPTDDPTGDPTDGQPSTHPSTTGRPTDPPRPTGETRRPTTGGPITTGRPNTEPSTRVSSNHTDDPRQRPSGDQTNRPRQSSRPNQRPSHDPRQPRSSAQTPRPSGSVSPPPTGSVTTMAPSSTLSVDPSAPSPSASQTAVWGADDGTGNQQKPGTSPWWYLAPIGLAAAAGGGWWWFLGRGRPAGTDLAEEIDD